MLGLIARGPVAWVGVGATSLCVTFNFLSRPLHWPGRGPPVLFSQLMRWRTQVEWRAQSGGCQCVKGCWLCGGGLAPPIQEVDCVVVVGNVIDVIILDYWHLWTSGGLPVVGQNFLENGPPWGAGWCCYGWSAPPFRPSFHSIKCTLPALAATPLKQTWFNESCFTSWMWFTRAPPPISLVLHFKFTFYSTW